MLFKNLFKINLLLKTIICNYLIYIIFNFKCIPHNVGMFLYKGVSPRRMLRYSPQRGDVSHFKDTLGIVKRYSPQRGDVSARSSKNSKSLRYSPQRGDVSVD